MILKNPPTAFDSSDNQLATDVSLSTYFPKNTQYFYGYPAGEDSGFLNQVPPETEELVAMRPTCCAGPDVSVIGFAATNTPVIDGKLLDAFGIPQLPEEHVSLLPSEIDPSLTGAARNEAIKQALQQLSINNSLVMAQPYISQRLAPAYQISPYVTTWLNDKQNIQKLIPATMVPQRIATYENGADFQKRYHELSLPVVIKATSSSSGDGVHICTKPQHLKRAVEQLSSLTGPVLVEEYVSECQNYGLHFGIPCNRDQAIDFIGVNEQLTTRNGDFIGGIITSTTIPPEITAAKHYLEYVALPQVRAMGWYGVGCFDILIDENKRSHFVDCNFRMTGMSAYHFMVASGSLKPPLIGMSASFEGSREDLERKLLPYAGTGSTQKILQLIALSHHENTWRFNAALFYKNDAELHERCELLLSLGIKSEIFTLLHEDESDIVA